MSGLDELDDRGPYPLVAAAVPCPDWCRERPGHPYHRGPTHDLTRTHRARIRAGSRAGGVEVWITQDEHAAGPVMAGTVEANPHLNVHGPGPFDGFADDPTPLDADQLRAAAAVLTVAAGILDELT